MTITATDADAAAAAQLFETWLGFEFHDATPRRVHEFLAARASTLGLSSVEEYLRQLPRDRATTEEAQRLVNVITNGLTAFRRDAAQVEALGAIVTQHYARHGRTVNVWCAGCATGEEAFTVAMVAAENEVPVRVVGTDVNTHFLEQARLGRFDAWALRRLSRTRRGRWFREDDNKLVVDSLLSDSVEFRHHNILDPPPRPDDGADSGKWDVILCRNVVIYLARAAITRVVLNFADAVSADGYLVLGSSEQIGAVFPGFRGTQHGPTYIYRPEYTNPGRSAKVPAIGYSPFEQSLDEVSTDALDEGAIQKLIHDSVEQSPEGALACLEAACTYAPFSPEAHALFGAQLAAVGAHHRAATEFGKVLFLTPDNWWAALRRAEQHERFGELRQATQHYRRAVETIDEVGARGLDFDATLAVGPIGGLGDRIADHRDRANAALQRLTAKG
jgi:chemotaxis protein methyltransferase CheR